MLQAALISRQRQITGGGRPEVEELSTLEERIVAILGATVVEGAANSAINVFQFLLKCYNPSKNHLLIIYIKIR